MQLNNTIPQTFQSTLPRGERHYCILRSSSLIEFQSTLPRGERQPGLLPSFVDALISHFHAPTKGSDSCRSLCFHPEKISIHAPRGERQNPLQCRRPSTLIFQSTLPRGERQFEDVKMREDAQISIHAPTRGATHVGHCVSIQKKFQSTLPRGERQNPLQCRRSTLIFQIHAPTRGATV